MSIELFRFEFWVVGIEKLGFRVLDMHTAVCCFCNTAIFGSYSARSRERPQYVVFVILRYSGVLACCLERDRDMANLSYRDLWQIMGTFMLLIPVLADCSG